MIGRPGVIGSGSASLCIQSDGTKSEEQIDLSTVFDKLLYVVFPADA